MSGEVSNCDSSECPKVMFLERFSASMDCMICVLEALSRNLQIEPPEASDAMGFSQLTRSRIHAYIFREGVNVRDKTWTECPMRGHRGHPNCPHEIFYVRFPESPRCLSCILESLAISQQVDIASAARMAGFDEVTVTLLQGGTE